jgi:signal transduction histidine kinase
MSFWGGRELALRRRLMLLRDVGRDWNPRLGVDRTIGDNLGKMVRFFQADSCLLVVRRSAPAPTWRTYRVSRGQAGGAAVACELDEASGRMLTDLPVDRSVCYRRGDPAGAPEGCERLANLLDTDHFMSVAYVQRDGTRGRLYVCAGDRQCSQSKAEFLGQLTDTIAQLAENTDLMDQLVARAAEHERFRLSLDLHDTTVQPYIGLKLALDALHRQAGPGNPLTPRIADLLEMADATIQDLRGYASGLRGKTALTSEALAEAIREQASRMEKFYGVRVDVSVELPTPVGGAIAADLFHIASEGLSNVKRHTSARSAFIRLARDGPEIELSIGNEASEPVETFVPRSISQRAAALGGRSWVETASPRSTIVHVRIPA